MTFKTSAFKETTVYRPPCLIIVACLRLLNAPVILKRRPEDVKMVWVALSAERRRCRECTGDKKLFILFVLHEEFFCFKDVVVEVDVVDPKVHILGLEQWKGLAF